PAAPAKPAAPAQPAAPTKPAAPAHGSTPEPEVFIFMPTPGMGIETIEEENGVEDGEEIEVEDEEVVGQGNVPPVHRRDKNGKIIVEPFGTA
ncbi:hypothetical protein A2U01_0038271, partial [Trifolium medium]|nr:hypothetical protein [Trifolium medium]